MTTAVTRANKAVVVWETVAPDYSGARDDEHLISLFLSIRTRCPATAKVYAYELSRFRRLAPKPLAAVTLDDLRVYVEALRGAGLGEVSVSRAVTVVRSLFRFGHEAGYLRWNVARAIRVSAPRGTPPGKFLTAGEVERLLDAARARGLRSLAMIGVLLATGLRRAELRAASWSELFDDGAGRVGLRVVGKGNKVRTVKIRADLLAVLRAMRRQLGLPEDLDPYDRTPLAMNRLRGRISDRGLHREVAVCARCAGIRKKVSPHWLRHTHATLALQGGASILQVQQALGHSSVATTGVYLHAARGLEDTAADHLPFGIQGG
ncbi:MAG: tyrosine-type recombinase/integrase [Deltaproteobacteria bacterium]|nr:tyrosine-type recombinase/integrase [Deltaproteobacteria bacterium]